LEQLALLLLRDTTSELLSALSRFAVAASALVGLAQQTACPSYLGLLPLVIRHAILLAAVSGLVGIM
jgi:hypothetical protein